MPVYQSLVPMVAPDGPLLYFILPLVLTVKAFRKPQSSGNASRTGKWRKALKLWIYAAVSWRKRNAGQNQEKVQTANEAKRYIMEAYGRKETAWAGMASSKKKKKLTGALSHLL